MSYDKKNDKVRTKRNKFSIYYISHFQKIILKKVSDIPELDLNYASFADSVAPTGQISNFFLHDLQELPKLQTISKPKSSLLDKFRTEIISHY